MVNRIKLLTSGESHGKGSLGIIEGIPAGLKITEKYINAELSRRQKGYGRGARMKIENDKIEIYNGVRFGKTLGSPIGLILPNKDWGNWVERMSIEKSSKQIDKITLPRPGHADLAGIQKYDFDDIRNVIERSSARETAMRVALGSICKKMIKELGIEVGSRVTQINKIKDENSIPTNLNPEKLSKVADLSPVRCLDKTKEKEMIKIIEKAKKQGDSLGGVFEVIANGLPYGLGNYNQWNNKLQVKITECIMSINAFKGIEIGLGFGYTDKLGSQVHDEIGWKDNKYVRFSNNAGGIEGGMSNAQPIIIKSVMKPIPTLTKPLRSVDINTKKDLLAHKERTDSCSVPSASIIAESMLSIAIADSILEKFGGDSMQQLKKHIDCTAKY
tara:strand:- start:1910 stop:3070 length:1161 start_codon:yes stop_codon:yes gene_type:complete